MNPTEKYLQENQAVQSLRKIVLDSIKPRKFYLDSVSGIFKRNLLAYIVCAKNYPIEIFRGFENLKATYNIAGSRKLTRAIVIGNGPSQGYLSTKILNEFVNTGGETICINYWNLNENLSSHAPSWMLFSDPATFNNKHEPNKSQTLIDYLKQKPSINIVGPWHLIQQVRQSGVENPVFSFIDCELPFWKNIHPLLPRGYISMTLYKSLAWAVHLGYSEIGLIGMDNTYPRNLYCDENNHVLNLDIHAGIDDQVFDISALYPTVASRMAGLFLLFRDLECFPDQGIVNLDQYSLTDRFRKVKLSEFLQLQ